MNSKEENDVISNNILQILSCDTDSYETLPPLSICTDLHRLGVNINISKKKNILAKNNFHIINSIPRVEQKKKGNKVCGVEYLLEVYKDTYYPSSKVKTFLIKKTGLKRKQIENWFHNKRKRNKIKLSFL